MSIPTYPIGFLQDIWHGNTDSWNLIGFLKQVTHHIWRSNYLKGPISYKNFEWNHGPYFLFRLLRNYWSQWSVSHCPLVLCQKNIKEMQHRWSRKTDIIYIMSCIFFIKTQDQQCGEVRKDPIFQRSLRHQLTLKEIKIFKTALTEYMKQKCHR